ncbi:hypothetical protein AMR41_28560 [Hapalosiphon sp. MRB220]|nr:hypothetical protein AMR41_28560 [Hapalosiphon sp. MRB220]
MGLEGRQGRRGGQGRQRRQRRQRRQKKGEKLLGLNKIPEFYQDTAGVSSVLVFLSHPHPQADTKLLQF